MMASEYRRLLPEHIAYTQKNLLQGQLESLMSLKNLHAYRQLRQEELMQKIKLKKLIEEAKQEMDILVKALPEPVKAAEENEGEETAQAVKRTSLEDELDAIRQKLAQLQ